MSTPTPPAVKPAALLSERGDDTTDEQHHSKGAKPDTDAAGLQSTFRIFSARLDPATREALRAKLGLSGADLDTLRSQDDLVAALRDLSSS